MTTIASQIPARRSWGSVVAGLALSVAKHASSFVPLRFVGEPGVSQNGQVVLSR